MTKDVRIYSGEKTGSSINCVGKSEKLHENIWTELLSHTMHKNKFKNGLKTNVRSEIIKLLQENVYSKPFDIDMINIWWWWFLLRQGKQKQK